MVRNVRTAQLRCGCEARGLKIRGIKNSVRKVEIFKILCFHQKSFCLYYIGKFKPSIENLGHQKNRPFYLRVSSENPRFSLKTQIFISLGFHQRLVAKSIIKDLSQNLSKKFRTIRIFLSEKYKISLKIYQFYQNKLS